MALSAIVIDRMLVVKGSVMNTILVGNLVGSVRLDWALSAQFASAVVLEHRFGFLAKANAVFKNNTKHYFAVQVHPGLGQQREDQCFEYAHGMSFELATTANRSST